MKNAVRRILFRTLGTESYLTLLQRGYFALYDTGALMLSRSFAYHRHAPRMVRPGDTVVDIGANLGYYSIPFARAAGPEGRVYAVEPIPVYNRVFMKKARRYDNIELMPYALGTQRGRVTMVENSGDGYLSTGLPHVYDAERDGECSEGFTFEVEMERASCLFGSLDRLDYVKCDIEGFESVVLRDMREIIGRHKPVVQAEIWGPNERELLGMFREMGYGVYKLSHAGKLTCDTSVAGDFIFIHPDNPRAL